MYNINSAYRFIHLLQIVFANRRDIHIAKIQQNRILSTDSKMFQKISSLGTDIPQLDEIIASKSAGHHLSYCFVSKTIYLNSHIFCLIGITVLIQPYRNLIFMQTREHFNWFPSQQTTGSCDSRTLYRV